jgi:hypothetical protein
MLHAVGTVTEPTATLLIGCIQNMQIIHSQNQRQAPFDGLTPLRGEWDEYFLLRALFNRRETKMSPQTYR